MSTCSNVLPTMITSQSASSYNGSYISVCFRNYTFHFRLDRQLGASCVLDIAHSEFDEQ